MVDKRRVQMAKVHHDYFRLMEHPIQAYILGLLASDGNISSSRPRIRLSVHQKDIELVEMVREELAPGIPFQIDRQMVCFQFNSPIMCNDLAVLNIVPRKSLTLAWPDALPRHLINSFLLGVFDGDGWITIDQRKAMTYYTLGFISGSLPFLKRVVQEVNAAMNLPLINIGTVNGRAYSIRYGGKSAKILSEWLHRDLPGLIRKRMLT